MSQVKEKYNDDDYMYKFRTKPCTKKRCRNPPKCFDAHSEVMRRRVPIQGNHGLYNYIPEPCPQWQKMKKCTLRGSCQRSHGWLEIIFHPLLYKTKMCKSNLKNGVCREYGVYCAKAHNPSDIRNLVQIYGENWKRHYDLTLREKLADSPSAIKLQRKYMQKLDNTLSRTHSIGKLSNNNLPAQMYCVCSEQTHSRTSTRTSPTLTSVKPDIDPNSPMLFTSPLLFGDCTSTCDHLSALTLEEGVACYTQLYGKKNKMVKVDDSDLNTCKSLTAWVPWDCTWHSTRTDVVSLESSASLSSNSNFRSSLSENWKNGDQLDVHWKIDFKVSQDNKENKSSNGDEENSESLFAQPPYEANLNRNIFDPGPETPERQRHEQ